MSSFEYSSATEPLSKDDASSIGEEKDGLLGGRSLEDGFEATTRSRGNCSLEADVLSGDEDFSSFTAGNSGSESSSGDSDKEYHGMIGIGDDSGFEDGESQLYPSIATSVFKLTGSPDPSPESPTKSIVLAKTLSEGRCSSGALPQVDPPETDLNRRSLPSTGQHLREEHSEQLVRAQTKSDGESSAPKSEDSRSQSGIWSALWGFVAGGQPESDVSGEARSLPAHSVALPSEQEISAERESSIHSLSSIESAYEMTRAKTQAEQGSASTHGAASAGTPSQATGRSRSSTPELPQVHSSSALPDVPVPTVADEKVQSAPAVSTAEASKVSKPAVTTTRNPIKRSKAMPRRKRAKLKSVQHPYISAISLSLWDNIFGPRVEMVWEGSESLSAEVVEFASRQVMAGEIDKMFLLEMQSDQGSALRQPPVTKFHVFPDLGFIATSMVFSANYGGSTTKMALSLILRRESLMRYLPLHVVVEDRLLQLQSRLRDLLEVKPKEALEVFTHMLDAFAGCLDNMYTAGIDRSRVTPQWLVEKHPAPGVDFVARAITSHLQTHCSTVVIGKTEQSVNALVDLLAVFLNQEQRKRSSFVRMGQSYIPDLILQGLLQSKIPITDEDVIQSLLPTTIIDIDRHSIIQTHPFHVHTVLRREYMKLQRKTLVGQKVGRNLWLAQPGLFRYVKEPAPMVGALMTECRALPPSCREGFFRGWMRQLVRRAITLIKFVENKVNKMKVLDTATVKRLRAQLELTNEGDFAILLALAETYSPGIYFTLAGDPASIEEKFIQLFESF